MSKRERSEEVTLESSDGTHFFLNLEDAKKSKTICNLIEDIGIDRPIPIIAISNDILRFIVGMLSGTLYSGLEYTTVIQIFLAANYLDIESILKSMADIISQLYLKYEKYDIDFNENELKTLKNIRVCSLRKSPEDGNFCLLDVPRDVIAKYILPKFNLDVYEWYFNRDTLEELMHFRFIHRYFWHVTTQHILNQVRYKFDSSFSDEQIFDCLNMYVSDSEIKLSRFGLTKKDILPKNIEDLNLMDFIIIGFKKHESIERMNDLAEKKRASALKAKEKRKNNQEKIEKFEGPNKVIVENYMESLGYLKYCDYHIPRLTYLIGDPEVDEHVQIIRGRLRNYTRIILQQVPLDLNYLKKFLKHEKIVEVLTSTFELDFDNFEEEDVVTLDKTFKFKTLDQFYDILKIYQEDMLADMAKVFIIKKELEKRGLHFSKQEILYYDLDEQIMIDVIANSSDLNFIYRHTRSKAKFLSILKKENIYVSPK
jgi:hypothetical protein